MESAYGQSVCEYWESAPTDSPVSTHFSVVLPARLIGSDDADADLAMPTSLAPAIACTDDEAAADDDNDALACAALGAYTFVGAVSAASRHHPRARKASISSGMRKRASCCPVGSASQAPVTCASERCAQCLDRKASSLSRVAMSTESAEAEAEAGAEAEADAAKEGAAADEENDDDEYASSDSNEAAAKAAASAASPLVSTLRSCP